jgi:hypothetical protein
MLRWILPFAMLGMTAACEKAKAGDKDESFRLINADALVALQADAAHPVHIFDANHEDFRKAEGVIPGAVMLSGHDFDLAATLPADKAAPLVFYCSSKL